MNEIKCDKYQINIKVYQPKDKALAVIQLLHGASEHIDRYDDFANVLASEGFLVVGYNHPGHKDNKHLDNRIHFTKDQMINYSINVNKYIVDNYSDLPIIGFGHSMGSLILRYIIAKKLVKFDHVILCGTIQKDYLTAKSASLMNVLLLGQDNDKATKLSNSLAFEKSVQVLSYDQDNINYFTSDKYCGELFTKSGLKALIDISQYVWSNIGIKNLGVNIEYLLIAGSDDLYSKGNKVVKLSKKMEKNNCLVEVEIFDQMKHEILNETNKEEVYNFIIKYLKKSII